MADPMTHNRATDEWGDPLYGPRLNYAAQTVNELMTAGTPKTREGLARAVRNLRASGGVIISTLAADLIENALAVKD